MSTPVRDELRDLLLHHLPEGRARELEERLMGEEDAAERLQEATYDLLDDYAAGRLSPADRGAVERHLLASDENRWRLDVARGLASRRSRASRPERRPVIRRPPRIPVWRGPVAALFAACVALVAVIVTRKLDHAGTNSSPTVTLLADAARGASIRTIQLPSRATLVRLQAEVDATGAAAYRMAVTDITGRSLFVIDGLSPHRAGAYVYVEAEIPVRDLAPGDHRIVVAPAGGTERAPAAATWDLRGVLDQ
jgi:hypothetical protein